MADETKPKGITTQPTETVDMKKIIEQYQQECVKKIQAVLDEYSMKLDVYGDVKNPLIRVLSK